MNTSTIDTRTLARIAALRLQGRSLPEIAQTLTVEGFRTRLGGRWYPSTVRQYCHLAGKRLAGSARRQMGIQGRRVA